MWIGDAFKLLSKALKKFRLAEIRLPLDSRRRNADLSGEAPFGQSSGWWRTCSNQS